ncbi:MAG: S-layer homology domain-containing protein [Clostridia bacterium]|nr:S-layer homology domain-containing protein [Clostridia bacterium]
MKKKLSLITLIAAFALSCSVFAESGIESSFTADQESRLVSVNMTVEDDEGGTAATGIVVNGEGTVVYAAQGFTDADGSFGFSYINNDENGSYTLTVSAPRKGLYKSSDFKMLTNSMKTAISETDKTAEGMKSIIENYGEYMNLDLEAFNALSDQDAVYSFMASDIYVDLDSTSSVADGFYGAVIVRTLKEGGDAEDYQAFLDNETYSILNTDGIPKGEKLSLFDEVDSTVKAGVLDKVVKNEYKSASELTNALEFYVLQQSLEKAAQWTEVNPVLKKYQKAGLLDISFTDYDKLKSPEKADKALMGKSYEDYDAIEAAFEAAVVAAKGKTTTSTGGSGGGGGVVLPSVVTPEPVEKAEQTVSASFTDMGDYLWANEAVSYLVDKGIISGMGDGTFAPANGLTREEISTIMVRTQKLDTEGKASAFNDVAVDRWSYPYVSAVYEAGLMVGVSGDMFGATSKITRNEFAVIMKRLIDLYGVTLTENSNPGEYADAADIPEWAAESVRYLKATGLMLGNTGDRFEGSTVISRAYACNILYTVLNAVNYDSEV